MTIDNKFFPKIAPERILILLILALAFFLRARLPDASYLNIYAARDIQRSVLLLQGKEFPWYGPETTYWKRLPGPFLYFFQLPPLLATRDPAGLIVWIAALATFAIFLAYKIGKECFGWKVGLYAALLWAVFPLSISNLRWYWNPVYLFSLVALALYLALRMTLLGKTRYLPWIVALIFLAGQIHLSAYFLLASLALLLLVFRVKPSKRDILLTLLVILVVNSPFFIAKKRGVREVEKIPLVAKFKRESRTIGFNPNFFIALKQNSSVQDNEHVTNVGFVNISPYFEDLKSGGNAEKAFFLKAALLGSNVLWLFLWAGVFFSLADSILSRRFENRIKVDETKTSRKALLALFLWILPASLGLMFWNFSDPQKIYPPDFLTGKKVYSCIPHRYFFIIYPVQFLLIAYVMGLLTGGVRSVYHDLFKNKIDAFGERRTFFMKNFLSVFFLVFLIIPPLYLSYHFISDAHKSKIWGYHCGYRARPIYTTGFTKDLVRTLIRKHGITLRNLRENNLLFFLVYGFIERELEIDYFFLHLEKIFPGLKWETDRTKTAFSPGEYLVVTDEPVERWDQFLKNSKVIEKTEVFEDSTIPMMKYHIISDPQYPQPDYINWRNPYFDPW